MPGKENIMTDAILGRYRVHLEEDGLLVLKHPSGICFDLTVEETVALQDFISIYRKALLAIDRDQSRETDPQLARIVVKEQAEQNDHS
jgi:hypothetical protein